MSEGVLTDSAMGASDPGPDLKPWRGPLALASIAIALWVIARLAPDVATLERLGDVWLRGDPLIGVPVFLSIGTAMTAVGLPRQSVALVGGYLFGTVFGGLLGLLAMLGGCVLAYQAAAALGAERIHTRFPSVASCLENWTRDDVFRKTLMIRLLPVGSNLATNLAAGIMRTRRWPFFTASTLGFVPQALVFTLVGSGIDEANPAPIASAAVLLAISVLIGLSIARRSRD